VVWDPIKFKIQSNFQLFTPKGRRDAPISVKFGTEKLTIGLIFYVRFHVDGLYKHYTTLALRSNCLQ